MSNIKRTKSGRIRSQLPLLVASAVVLFAPAVNAIMIEGKGSYSLQEYPRCLNPDSLDVSITAVKNEEYKSYELNLENTLEILPGKRCQLTFDGESNNGIDHFYIPNFGTDYEAGQSISY